MKGFNLTKAAIVAATAFAAAAPAFAQSNVTRYRRRFDRASKQQHVARLHERRPLERQDGVGHLGG